jgi:RNA polymerase sigma-70 factor (ECF subfamily)
MEERRRDQLQSSLTRLAAGDRAAFDEVFRIVWPLVRRFSERALRNAPDAEDTAQNVLIRVLSRAHEFDPNRAALPWILGIATYEMRTLRKKVERRREDLQDLESAEPAALDRSFEGTIIRRNLESALRDVIGELKTEDVATILAAVGAEQRPRVAAATFRKRFQRALDRLRQAWRAKHGIE